MGITNFFWHPVRAAVLKLLEGLINNADSSFGQKALSLFGLSEKDLQVIIKVKRMITHIAVDVDDKNSALHVRLRLAGEPDELWISANYIKTVNEESTLFTLQNLQTSKEWMTILFNDILVGEVISKDDLQFGADKLLGKVLNKIL